MNHHYNDIRVHIATPPDWFDENAVPRWGAFSPQNTANIYADEAVLLKIRCQNCGRPFLVCMSSSESQRLMASVRALESGLAPSLADEVRAKSIEYGDPPNIECCPSGPTMNSEPDRVVEFWRRNAQHDWERVPELEVDVEAEWAK